MANLNTGIKYKIASAKRKDPGYTFPPISFQFLYMLKESERVRECLSLSVCVPLNRVLLTRNKEVERVRA